MRKGKTRCKVTGCEKPPYLGNLCEEHYREDEAKSQQRRVAIDLLHLGIIDDERLRSSELCGDLEWLQDWWQRACREIQSPGSDRALQEEAEFAMEWCITFAQEIVDAERAARKGNPAPSLHMESTRQWVRERFRNLERGLMSNGVPRP